MSNPKLRCRQCEKRLGEKYEPCFYSASRFYNSVDEEGNFIDEITTELEEYYCPYCGQNLKLE